jgi:hypothetical protein
MIGLALGGHGVVIAALLAILGPLILNLVRRGLAPGSLGAAMAQGFFPYILALPFVLFDEFAGLFFSAALSVALYSAGISLLGHGLGRWLHQLILQHRPQWIVLMPIRAPHTGKLPVPLSSKAGRRILK